jgi:hypothetical protein
LVLINQPSRSDTGFHASAATEKKAILERGPVESSSNSLAGLRLQRVKSNIVAAAISHGGWMWRKNSFPRSTLVDWRHILMSLVRGQWHNSEHAVNGRGGLFQVVSAFAEMERKEPGNLGNYEGQQPLNP